MGRKLTWTLASIFVLVAGLVALKLMVPLSFAETEVRSPAVNFVIEIQQSGVIDPKECAARYLYFNSDYHSETPDRIQISEKQLSDKEIRITLHDPSCQDDSTRSSISRIYLERNGDGIWIPTRHEWSHTGRGRFGWTTKPTN